jgi:hypothetical protein
VTLILGGLLTAPGCKKKSNDASSASGAAAVDAASPTVVNTSSDCAKTVPEGTVGITLTATAGDDVGVTKVEFFVDGASVGQDTAAPFEVPWNIRLVAVGAHTVVAKAYDAAGKDVSDGCTVTTSGGFAQIASIAR